MKHIKNFESYYSDVILHFKYLDLQILENGDMKIYLNDEGKEYQCGYDCARYLLL